MEDFEKQELLDTVKRAKEAVNAISGYSQKQIDEIVKAIGKVFCENAEILAKEAVEETQFGDFDMKIVKHTNLAKYHWWYLKDKASVGCISEDKEKQMKIYAKPVGVVACITPATNPTETVLGIGMCAMKCGNALIACPHPSAKKVSNHGVELVRGVLRKFGAPADLFQSIIEPSIEKSKFLMSICDIVSATGGFGMVKSAYSSGRPSLGVGQGNVQTIMDKGYPEKWEDYAIQTIIARSADNGMVCTGDQCMHVHKDEVADVLKVFEKKGAYVVPEEKIPEIRKALFDKLPDGGYKVSTKIIGKSVAELAAIFNLDPPSGTEIFLLKVTQTAPEEILCREKMCRMTCYLPYETFEEGVAHAVTNLMVEGVGHTCCLYTENEAHIDYFAKTVPVVRANINGAGNLGGGNNFFSGIHPTISLGCGTWGNNSVSDNINYMHFMNTTRVIMKMKDPYIPTDDEIWN
jgi:succinate-semialdehyde dehydrogenase